MLVKQDDHQTINEGHDDVCVVVVVVVVVVSRSKTQMCGFEFQ
jgi:hypothetical protein